MTASSVSQPVASGARFTQFSLVRIILATLAMLAPVALTLILAHQIPDKSLRAMWPQLLAAALGAGGYVLYVRAVEQRAVAELSGPGRWRELGAGLALGAALFLVVLGLVAASGNVHFAGHASWTAMARPFAETVLVASFEEILFRGVIFRITERSLGTWAALLISSVVFALAHLPNEGITALAACATLVAGLLFAATYMATGRLWLAIGVHFAQNFVPSGVFALPTSGHPAAGYLLGQLSGPEWLSGGAYGLEGSAVTVVTMAVATVFLLRLAVRRGHVVARPRKES